MATITFEKVEHRVTKNVRCDACGKRLKRATTLYQTLSPFNKTSDGELKTRQQIMAELLIGEADWRKEREWCSPCWDATHLNAKDLSVGHVLESDVGEIPVTSVSVLKNAPGYNDTIKVNAGTEFETSYSPYTRVVVRPAEPTP